MFKVINLKEAYDFGHAALYRESACLPREDPEFNPEQESKQEGEIG